MKHQAAYSLLFLSGNNAPSKSDVESFMKKAGVSVDKESLDLFFKQIDGKSVVELIAAGAEKTVSMPSGGYAGPVAGAAAGGASAEEKPAVEEKKEEVEDVDMGGLFGDDEDDY